MNDEIGYQRLVRIDVTLEALKNRFFNEYQPRTEWRINSRPVPKDLKIVEITQQRYEDGRFKGNLCSIIFESIEFPRIYSGELIPTAEIECERLENP